MKPLFCVAARGRSRSSPPASRMAGLANNAPGQERLSPAPAFNQPWGRRLSLQRWHHWFDERQHRAKSLATQARSPRRLRRRWFSRPVPGLRLGRLPPDPLELSCEIGGEDLPRVGADGLGAALGIDLQHSEIRLQRWLGIVRSHTPMARSNSSRVTMTRAPGGGVAIRSMGRALSSL